MIINNNVISELKVGDTNINKGLVNTDQVFNSIPPPPSIDEAWVPLGFSWNYNRTGGQFTSKSITSIPSADTSGIPKFYEMFWSCSSLTSVPLIDTSNGTDFESMFSGCSSLRSITKLDLSKASWVDYIFNGCRNLSEPNIYGLRLSIDLSPITVTINKDSLLYIINNSGATSAITIYLTPTNFDKYLVDPDVIDALVNKPFVTLSRSGGSN